MSRTYTVWTLDLEIMSEQTKIYPKERAFERREDAVRFLRQHGYANMNDNIFVKTATDYAKTVTLTEVEVYNKEIVENDVNQQTVVDLYV